MNAPERPAARATDGLLARFAWTTGTALALVGAVTAVASYELTDSALRRTATARASLLALVTAAELAHTPPAARCPLLRRVASRDGVHVVLRPLHTPGGSGASGASAAPGLCAMPWPDHLPLHRSAPVAVLRAPSGRWAVAHEPLVAHDLDPATLSVAVALPDARRAASRLALELLLGLAAAAVVGIAASALVARDLATDVRAAAALAARMARGEVGTVDALPLHTPDEVGALVAAFNRLQQRFAEEAALHREALVRLDDNERRREATAATLRHELRTPLNSIVGFADLLLSGADGPLSEAQREDVAVIAQAGRHLLRMVDDVLDLSAMAAGRYALRLDVCDVAELTRAVVREAQGVARTRDVAVTLDAPDAAPRRADPVALRRALTNLVLNAVEHGGARVFVTLSHRPDGGLAVSVRDEGPGIDPQELRRLFKPFERGRSAEARGAGLGLAITLGLIELHGGTLSAHSEVGVGSTFTLTLPRDDSPEAPR